jgi:hypothetical protein
MRSLALLMSILLLAACTSSPRATTQTASLIGHEGDGSPLTTCNR